MALNSDNIKTIKQFADPVRGPNPVRKPEDKVSNGAKGKGSNGADKLEKMPKNLPCSSSPTRNFGVELTLFI